MVHSHHGATHSSANASSQAVGNRRRLFWAMLLTGGFMLVEVVGGLVSGSLTLLADAAHMLTDSVSLALAWLAFRLAERPADTARSFGYHRFPILAAFTNGISLLFVVAWIFYEAVDRFLNPSAILGGTMLVIALLGLVVNIVAFFILHGAERDNLNIRGALLHVLGDLLGSVAAIVAAVVIIWTDWTPIDPLLSVFVGLLVLRSAWMLIKEAGHVLLEGTPAAFSAREIGADLINSITAVSDVHHVHAWSLSQEKPLVTLHARIDDDQADPDTVRADIRQRLVERFGIGHATIEIEHNGCADLPAKPSA